MGNLLGKRASRFDSACDSDMTVRQLVQRRSHGFSAAQRLVYPSAASQNRLHRFRCTDLGSICVDLVEFNEIVRTNATIPVVGNELPLLSCEDEKEDGEAGVTE
jgi:hypothetical protein